MPRWVIIAVAVLGVALGWRAMRPAPAYDTVHTDIYVVISYAELAVGAAVLLAGAALAFWLWRVRGRS